MDKGTRSKAALRENTMIREAIFKDKIKGVQEAQPINEEEYDDLNCKPTRTTRESYQLLRFRIENHYKLDLSKEDIKFVLIREWSPY